MAIYFYYDENGEKQGPCTEEQLRKLATSGTIRPSTKLVTENDNTISRAKQVVPLFRFKEKDESSGQPASPGLFDIHFTRFVSNTWISVIWVIAIIVLFCGALSAIYWAFQVDEMTGMISLVLVPLITAISLLFTRMALEFDKVVFRIETNTRETKDLLREIKEQLEKK